MKHYSRIRAFTLIELLTVIAIIGVLAAILIPTVGRVRASARAAQGVSNLRQIMLATLSYANDNKSRFPYNEQPSSIYYYTKLSTYLLGTGDERVNSATPSPIFRCPSAAIDAGDNHFTGNSNLLSLAAASRRISDFRDPSLTVVYFDGGQAYSGNVELSGWSVDNGGLHGVSARTQTSAWLSTVVNPGPNNDTSAGNIRWRMPGTKAKFALLDGHVKTLGQSEVTRRMFVLD